MQLYQMPGANEYARADTQTLRDLVVIENLFTPGAVTLNYTDLDRAIVGSAVPVAEPLSLPDSKDFLRTEFFTERRELGVLNIGGPGSVTVDGKTFEMASQDGLYVSRGSREIQFASADKTNPAAFYLISYPAHADYPTSHIKKAAAAAVNLGETATANKRTIVKYIHPDGVKSCQLVMGVTQLDPGSVWNTMPPHTHLRRSEVYLYFGLAPGARVMHLMGKPQETRHVVLADRQAVLSPSWSIHAGVGTAAYTFCWAMGGENQAFNDMDAIAIGDLK